MTSNTRDPDRRFATTEWSLVLAAGDSHAPGSREALSSLCRIYWYPVYAQIRYRGQDSEGAKDLTQGFFAEFLEKRSLKLADPQRGRFRAFLKTSIDHFLSHERQRAGALKRGGEGLRSRWVSTAPKRSTGWSRPVTRRPTSSSRSAGPARR